MPIATYHTTADKGLPPLPDPFAGLAVEARLVAERERSQQAHAEERGDRPPSRLKCTDAMRCARQIGLGILGVPKDIAYDQAALLTFSAGDWYHQIVQEALVKELDARCEVRVDETPDGDPIGGYADAVYTFRYEPRWPEWLADLDGLTVVAEIKSQAGYGFDLAVGARRSGEGPGPKAEWLIQAGLYALAPDILADIVHIIIINKDRCTVAEWLIGVNQPLPHLEGQTVRGLVEDELVRFRGILALLDDGLLPARLVPGFGLVEVPPEHKAKGAKPWNCAYCSWQPTCAGLATGPVPVELVTTEVAD